MARLRVCFEINGLGEDEHGKPCPAGMQMDFGECSKDVPYVELTMNLNIREVLKACCLSFVPLSAVRIITPEEYDQKYGEE